MPAPPEALVAILEHEMETNTGFARIHAAEALINHGYGFKVAPILLADANVETPGYRLGVWRTLARIAKGESERRDYIRRIREVLNNAAAPDRVGAAESLAKLRVVDRSDRPLLEEWLRVAKESDAPFPLWLLLLSSNPGERPQDEARLARLLDSPEPLGRLRSAYALEMLGDASPESVRRIDQCAKSEPAHSRARVYLLAAAYRYAPPDSSAAALWKHELIAYLASGEANEQLEASTAIGARGSAEDIPALSSLLKSVAADARLGAASALLHLSR
jgi:SSS family solute:Na+ symporter